MKFSLLHIILFLAIFRIFPAVATDTKNQSVLTFPVSNEIFLIHSDSTTPDFRYAGEKRGIKPCIAPALLITAGTTLHFMPDAKQNFRNYIQGHFAYRGNFDEYAQYAPIAAVYLFNATGLKGKNNFGNVTAIALKSFLLNGIITKGLKTGFKEPRPNGGNQSFPSGHASKAFTLAHIMHKEFGEKSVWFSIGAYSCATTVGALRLAGNEHWVSDVLAGAGIGILSTELIYLTHQYKWDKNHFKQLDIFPFQNGKLKGLSLFYTF